MRKILLIAMAICSITSVDAKEISEAEAARIASEFINTPSHGMQSPRNGKLSLAKSTKGYYAYNRGTNGGFVVVAADDAMGSKVLGYADRGTLDFNSMPANLRWWLEQYDNMATNVAIHPTVSATRADASTTRAAIEPLLTTTWYQVSPYNDLCPEYEEGTKSATGCMATAMAQVMYYHKWPEHGTGTVSYEWEGKTLTADLSQDTYDWANMTDTYDDNSTEEAKAAVALLMRDCGYALNMDYGPESGTNIIMAYRVLVNNFNYDKALDIAFRSFFTYDEWHEKLYNELDNKRPMVITGGAHAFIFDGYMQQDGNDYYHVNWGWGGQSDGYFVCADLNPLDQGVGGSEESFTTNLIAFTGIQAPVEGSTAFLNFNFIGNVMPQEVEDDTEGSLMETNDSDELATITIPGIFYNLSMEDNTVYFGLKVCKQGTDDVFYIKSDEPTTIDNVLAEVNLEFSLDSLPTNDAKYNVYLACKRNDDDNWQDVRVSKQYSSFFVLGVEDGQLSFENGENIVMPTATDINILGTEIYPDSTAYVMATITATQSDFCGSIYALTSDTDLENVTLANDHGVGIDLRKGESVTVSFSFATPSEPGDYILVLINENEEVIGGTDFSVVDTPTAINEAATNGKTQPIRIYSINGKLVGNQTAVKPNLTVLPSGAYVVKMGNKTKKVVVNK